MQKIPSSETHAVTVESFYKAARQRVPLTLEGGKSGLGRRIPEPAINRPAFALTGFYQYFANRRVQAFGAAEHAYLASLEPGERREKLDRFLGAQIPCVVVARNRKVLPEIAKLADAHGVPVFRTTMITGTFVNAATLVMESLTARRSKYQGTMMEILGVGVLIEGAPGVGKSETALALIERGHALVSDDVTMLRIDGAGDVIGSSIDVTRYHMEIRGLGIIHVPSLFGVGAVRGEKKLDVIVTLVPRERYERDVPDWNEKREATLLGVDIPHIMLPVAPGRDLANLVEVAARDLKLRQLGHDAAKELDEKLITALSGGGA